MERRRPVPLCKVGDEELGLLERLGERLELDNLRLLDLRKDAAPDVGREAVRVADRERIGA